MKLSQEMSKFQTFERQVAQGTNKQQQQAAQMKGGQPFVIHFDTATEILVNSQCINPTGSQQVPGV